MLGRAGREGQLESVDREEAGSGQRGVHLARLGWLRHMRTGTDAWRPQKKSPGLVQQAKSGMQLAREQAEMSLYAAIVLTVFTSASQSSCHMPVLRPMPSNRVAAVFNSE